MIKNGMARLSLARAPLIGETIPLEDGVVIQKPHERVIRALQAITPRLKYVEIDIDKAKTVPAQWAYYKGVTDDLGKRVVSDFPDRRLATRGTVLSLRDEYQHYTLEEATHDVSKYSFGVDPRQHRTMNSVLTVLRTGTDRRGFLTSHLQGIGPENELGHRVTQWLNNHTPFEYKQALEVAGGPMADNLFPSLLVYDANRMQVDMERRIVDPTALMAIYVTDRIIDFNWVNAEAV